MQDKWNWSMDEKTENIYRNLCSQIEKVFRHTRQRQGSEYIISNEYNPCGDRISRTTKILAGGLEKSCTTRYSYDVTGRATAVEIPGFSPLQFTRNAMGHVTREMLGDSLKRTFDYSPEGYLTAQKVLKAEGPVFEQHYTYDRAGNMLNKKDSVFGTDQFRYDPIGRIISHTNPEGRIKRYLNDPAGDLLSTGVKKNDEEWSREGEFEGISYRFDRAGNLKERTGKDGQSKFVWDASQRLIESIKDGRITRYRYDPLGRRISKETDGKTTRFFWDGDVLLGDIQTEKEECIRQREWVYYPESFEPLAMLQGQELYVYHNDPNGCPTRLLDTDGNVVWAARYDALGKVERIALNRVDNPIRMQGQYFDSETGLYYNRYRYFEPMIGAFVSHDPLGLAAGENVYAFAPNELGWVDPLGLEKNCTGISKKGAGKAGGTPEVPTTRVRHYTNRKGINGIEQDGNIIAKDNNRVYVEPANKKPLSQIEAENKYQLKTGKGRDYVEFDVPDSQLEWIKNPRHGTPELTIKGGVEELKNPNFVRRK